MPNGNELSYLAGIVAALQKQVGALYAGGGAPADARYIVQEAHATLTNEQSLGALTTGLLMNTVTAGVGVLSKAVAGTDYEAALAAGTSAQYYRGDKLWATLNQAAVAGLTTADGPTFAGLSVFNAGGISSYLTVEAGATGQEVRYNIHVPNAASGSRWWRFGAGSTGPTANKFNIDVLSDDGLSVLGTPFSAIASGAVTLAGSTTITDGDVIVTSGHGIDFSAAHSAATHTSLLLNAYEEGTWTPGIAFGGGATGITYNASYLGGYYTKIGNIVHVSGIVFLTSKGSSTGPATITGLPFTVANNVAAYSPATLQFRNITFANQFDGICLINTKTIGLEEVTEAGALTDLSNADFANNSGIIVSATYRVE